MRLERRDRLASMLLLFLLAFALPTEAAVAKFANSYILTSADVDSSQKITVTNEPGDYFVYAVVKQGATNPAFFKDVLVQDESGGAATTVADIAALPSTSGETDDIGRKALTVKVATGTGITVSNTHAGPSTVDPYTLYIVKSDANRCPVYSIENVQTITFADLADYVCGKTVTFLSAELSFAIVNPVIIDNADFRVHTAPNDALDDDNIVFRTNSFTVAHSASIAIAGPVVTIYSSRYNGGNPLRFDLNFSPKYSGSVKPGHTIAISSQGFSGLDKSYNTPYVVATTVPATQHYALARLSNLQVTVRGSVPAGGTLILTIPDGKTTIYNTSTFSDSFTTTGTAVDITRNYNWPDIRYAVSFTAT